VAGLGGQLGELAARFYGTRSNPARLLGVTGTNGKTSVAWFLRDALTALGEPCALIGTLGMSFGGKRVESGRTTPDVLCLHRTLAGFRQQGATACAMEVSSHALDQGRVDGLSIQVAIFTNLSRDHLDYHGDMETYFAAKARLFARPEVRLAAINRDDAHGRRLLAQLPAGVKAVSFGHDVEADVHPRRIDFTAGGLHLTLAVDATEFECELPLYGDFNVSNVMAVVAVLHGLGHDVADIRRALAALTPVPGRMEPVIAAAGPRVLVDYAHTPDGLEKALTAVREHFSGRIWCVFGCGGNRDNGKRPQMAAIAERLADRVVLTSDNPRDEDPADILAQMATGLAAPQAAMQIIDRAQAVAATIAAASAEDLVLIAGKGHEDYQEVRGVKLPMDDRELARAALAHWQGGGPCV
jgi:UDP-N-acetylmuramoyl-L-alanyl-D-glutamate--2,6-diaminopimelate ligase